MPKIEKQLERSTLIGPKIVNVKTNRLGRGHETKNSIIQRLNLEIIGNATNHRLEDVASRIQSQPKLRTTKGDDQQEAFRGD